MNGQYSWKRTQDIEIDLADLLQSLCMQWKKAAACALAFALISGIYGWSGGRDIQDADVSVIAEEAVLTEMEEQAVADAVLLKNEIRGLETYLDSSVLMQIDPYHKNRYIMLYSVGNVKRQQVQAVTESYLNFIVNGGAADALLRSGSDWEMDKSCLSELIAAYQKTYSSSYLTAAESADSSQTDEALFYVEISGRDAAEAEKMALEIQDILKNYSDEVRQNTGSHRIKLVNSMQSITADSGLQSLQHDKKSLLSSNRTNLKTMTDAFSKEQMAVYKEEAAVENEDGRDSRGEHGLSENEEDAAASGGNFKRLIKYILLGLAGGIFIYGCAFLCWYILRDTVKNTDELKRLYTFPVYGGILLPDRNGKQKQTVPGAQMDAYGKTEAQTLSRIRLACRKQGITKLCAAADFPLSKGEKECLWNMAQRLKDFGIDMAVSENVSSDTAVWDSMVQARNILLVLKTGMTTHRMIDDAMGFYLENGMAVAGAVAFLQN